MNIYYSTYFGLLGNHHVCINTKYIMTEENCKHKQNLMFAIILPPDIFFI